MEHFFLDFDWKSFWMNSIVSSIFLLLSIVISIKLIPHFTVKLLKKKRKKYIVTKIAYIIQEFCEFIEKSPFKDSEITTEQLSVFTNKEDLKNYRFIGIIGLNIFKEITHIKVKILILESLTKLNPEDRFELVKMEKKKLDRFRSKLESIINYHSLDIDEEIISDVSQLCLEIRALEIKYNYNHSVDDLIEKGLIKRTGVFGISEIAEIYRLILNLLKKLLELSVIEVQIEKKK
ncbi:hypothetical protein [Lacinutrix sp. Hel_I_90]|uniref:hypothetical protein n=1 Tax=Lacinutrix sp. Hel_I_90 TaxID=1249999 RepID=UPI0005C92804|nr:hypothetical protein [Lacinutrix sp. Hel_I_90]